MDSRLAGTEDPSKPHDSDEQDEKPEEYTSAPEIDERLVLWERKRFYCCLGWQRPLFHPGWRDGQGRKVHLHLTAAYRKAMAGDKDAPQHWDWLILTSEATDAEGWEYARCFIGNLRRKRFGGRALEQRMDMVKRRQWVHTNDVDKLLATAKKGAVHLYNPVELAEKQRKAKEKAEQGLKEIWTLVAELDANMQFKSIANALLDPVALRSVSVVHSKQMLELQERAIRELPPATIAPTEVWQPAVAAAAYRPPAPPTPTPPPTRPAPFSKPVAQVQMVVHKFLDALKSRGGDQQSDTPHTPRSKQGSQVQKDGPVAWLQRAFSINTHNEGRQGRRGSLEGAMAEGPGTPPAAPGATSPPARERWAAVAAAAASQRATATADVVSVSTAAPGDTTTARGLPQEDKSADLASLNTPADHASGDMRDIELGPTEEGPHTHTEVPAAQDTQSGAAQPNGTEASARSVLGTDAQGSSKGALQSKQGTSVGAGAVAESTEARIPNEITSPSPQLQTSSYHNQLYNAEPDTSGTDSQGSSPRHANNNTAVAAGTPPAGQPRKALSRFGASFMGRSMSLPHSSMPHHAEPPAPPAGATAERGVVLGAGAPRGGAMLHKSSSARLNPFERAIGGAHAAFDNAQALFRHGRVNKGPRAGRRSTPGAPALVGGVPTGSGRMVLSLPEFECAAGHALCIYGDLDVYVGGIPLQSHYTGIEKYTGVPEKDVLMAIWRSSPFLPAHYVCIDHAKKKIVVCIRGTMEVVDGITDLVGKPIVADFGPGLIGVVHQGIMEAAQGVAESVRDDVLASAAKYPGYAIFVTGHSLGGGAAALTALLLRKDERLSMHHRAHLRAVCLAPAAVMNKALALACQPFVTTIVWRNDLVPRVDVASVAKFVQQVAHASPLKRAMLALWKAFALTGPKPTPKDTTALKKQRSKTALETAASDAGKKLTETLSKTKPALESALGTIKDKTSELLSDVGAVLPALPGNAPVTLEPAETPAETAATATGENDAEVMAEQGHSGEGVGSSPDAQEGTRLAQSCAPAAGAGATKPHTAAVCTDSTAGHGTAAAAIDSPEITILIDSDTDIEPPQPSKGHKGGKQGQTGSLTQGGAGQGRSSQSVPAKESALGSWQPGSGVGKVVEMVATSGKAAVAGAGAAMAGAGAVVAGAGAAVATSGKAAVAGAGTALAGAGAASALWAKEKETALTEALQEIHSALKQRRTIRNKATDEIHPATPTAQPKPPPTISPTIPPTKLHRPSTEHPSSPRSKPLQKIERVLDEQINKVMGFVKEINNKITNKGTSQQGPASGLERLGSRKRITEKEEVDVEQLEETQAAIQAGEAQVIMQETESFEERTNQALQCVEQALHALSEESHGGLAAGMGDGGNDGTDSPVQRPEGSQIRVKQELQNAWDLLQDVMTISNARPPTTTRPGSCIDLSTQTGPIHPHTTDLSTHTGPLPTPQPATLTPPSFSHTPSGQITESHSQTALSHTTSELPELPHIRTNPSNSPHGQDSTPVSAPEAAQGQDAGSTTAAAATASEPQEPIGQTSQDAEAAAEQQSVPDKAATAAAAAAATAGPAAAAAAAPADTAASTAATTSGKLLQPLLPPGTVFWLLPDNRPDLTRARGMSARLTNKMRAEVLSRLNIPQPAAQQRGRGPVASDGGDGSDASVGGMSPRALRGAGSVASEAPHTFMAGLMADLQDTPIPDPAGGPTGVSSQAIDESDESNLVLLEANPSWFCDMYFFMKAMSDHMPLEYDKAIKRYLSLAKLGMASMKRTATRNARQTPYY